MKVNIISHIHLRKKNLIIHDYEYHIPYTFKEKTLIFNLIGQKYCHFNFFNENYTSSMDETTLQYQAMNNEVTI